MKRKIICLGLMMMLALGVFTGCEYSDSTSNKERNYTLELKSQAFDAVGLPDIQNFYEMAQLKEIYELRDNPNLICYWYIKNDMSGKWVYQGKCVGYGIPYCTQITNPDTTVALDYGTSCDYKSTAISQAEPNGLYSAVSTSATWILSVNEEGHITPTYVESEITVSQTKIESRLCEDWSLPSDYDAMSNSAEIQGTVDTSELSTVTNDVAEDSTEDTE